MRHAAFRTSIASVGAAVVVAVPVLMASAPPVRAAGGRVPTTATTHPSPYEGVPRGIVWQRGTHRAAPAAGDQLSYHGGGALGPAGIDGPPRIYLVFWGNQWGSAGSDGSGDYTFSKDSASFGKWTGTAPYLQQFYRGLGTNGELWSGVMTQYCDFVASGATSCPASNTAHVGYASGGVLAGVWYDDSAQAPGTASNAQIQQEAINAAEHFGNASDGSNTGNQYVIASPPGTDPGNVFNMNQCAWHMYTTQLPWSNDVLTFTNLPYEPDAPNNGQKCGAGAVNTSPDGTADPLDGVSINAGHEYAETMTDGYGGGWYDGSGNEDGDLCGLNVAAVADQNVSLSTSVFGVQQFAMQPTWGNDTSSCEFTHSIVNNPTVNQTLPKILVAGDSISNGVLGDYTWRFRLEQDLAGIAQFVGHRTGTENIYDDAVDLALVDGETPPTDNYGNPTDGYYNASIDASYNSPVFSEHDALWGWTYSLAKNYVGQDVKTYQPNYMLVELGFNDLAFLTSPSDTLANAKALIDNARAQDPSLKILIANVVTRTPLPQYPNLNSTIETYNSDLAAAVSGWSTASSPVRLVDLATPYDAAADSYDGLHPNGVGEYVIADAFASVLAQDFGLGTVPGPPPSSVPGITLATPGTPDASISNTGTLLQWNRIYGASGYRVYQRDITGNPSPLPAFTELPLPLPGDHWYAGWGAPGHTYQYEVASAKGNTESAPSAPVTITMPNPEPVADPPANITVTPANGTTSIALSWTAPTGNSNDANIDRYDVYWEDATEAATCGCSLIPNVAYPTGTSYTITGLIPGDTYDLAIASHTAAHGEGPWGGAPQAIVGDGAPGAPVISAGPNNTLTWSPVPGATGYWIYSGTQAIGSPVTWTRLPFEVPQGWNGSLVPGLYSVTAANGTLESAKSNSIAFTTAAARKQVAPAVNPTSWIPAWLRGAPNAPLIAMLQQRA